jgi:hypothetical protein
VVNGILISCRSGLALALEIRGCAFNVDAANTMTTIHGLFSLTSF